MSEYSNNQDVRAITMEMVAERCGVHRSTVQRALTGRGRVGKATADQVRAAAAEMGYDPAAHQAASRLVSMRHGVNVINHTIALYLPSIFYQHAYYLRILRGIMEVTVAAHFDLLTTYYDMVPPDSEKRPLPRSIVSGNVDAIITAVGTMDFTDLLQELRTTPYFGNRPIISLFEPVEDALSVVIDDYAGAYASCRHLLESGHRHILYAHPNPLCYAYQQRYRGYVDAFQHSGLSPDIFLHLVEIAWGSAPYETRFIETIQRGMTQYPNTTAVLLPNDSLAGLARDALRSLDKNIPDDVSLVGFDDTDPLLDTEGNNILTTVRVPLEDLGRIAARLTIDQVTGTPQSDTLPTVLPVTLVKRASTLAAETSLTQAR
ncbi:MAG: LacI family DNA-binding transcriptional regulator [Armatimonadota bacterium]